MSKSSQNAAPDRVTFVPLSEAAYHTAGRHTLSTTSAPPPPSTASAAEALASASPSLDGYAASAEAAMTAPLPPPPASDAWDVPIRLPDFSGRATTTTAAAMFGPAIPGTVNLDRVQKMAKWLRSQEHSPWQWIDGELRQIQFSEQISRREGSGDGGAIRDALVRNFEAALEAKIRAYLVATDKERENAATGPLTAPPPPPPTPPAPPAPMTAEEARKVASTLFELWVHGVTFSATEHGFKLYDPRGAVLIEDRTVLNAFPGEARRVIVESYNMNLQSLPTGDRTWEIIVPKLKTSA